MVRGDRKIHPNWVLARIEVLECPTVLRGYEIRDKGVQAIYPMDPLPPNLRYGDWRLLM